MNKMEPARNINLPPTLQRGCHCHNQCVFFYILVSYYHFFSHIADMPGLACLNHLSTGVKSKSSPAHTRDCTTAARVLRREVQSVWGEGRARRKKWGRLLARPPVGTRMCAAGCTVTNGVLAAVRLRTRPWPRSGSGSGVAGCGFNPPLTLTWNECFL